MSERAHAVAVIGAVALAALAVWVTARADFLAYPGWLSVQKADLVLGPVLVGVYWRRARPAGRFGWLLIGTGFVGAVYIAQSSSVPWLFGLGLVWESVIYLTTQLLIVAFPTGRIEGLGAKLVVGGSVAAALFNVWLVAMLPHTSAGGAISGCNGACPRNGLAFAPDAARAGDLLDTFAGLLLAVAAATLLLILWRFARGTPPQRRELAVGTLVAVVFLVCQLAYLSLTRFHVDAPHATMLLRWSFTVARSLVWYGFLLGLVAAQLFAGRAVQRLVRDSLGRPSRPELERMLRRPLADPSLELRFWDEQAAGWDGPVARPGGTTTVVWLDGKPSVAILHDPQLDDEPELLQAAGTVALLAADNAALDARFRRTVESLARSRAQAVRAVDDERRRLAADLHDGVQQRLVAIRLRLAALARVVSDRATEERIEQLGVSVEEAIADVREASHSLHPRVLQELGLVPALEQAVSPVPVLASAVGRQSSEVESAVYYSVLEAVQNALKHGGPEVAVGVALHQEDGVLAFEVTDDGPGFEASTNGDGIGLQNMHDRLAAVGGELSIVSAAGATVVAGSVPAV